MVSIMKKFDWNFFDASYTYSFKAADEVTDNKSKDYFENYITTYWKNVSDIHSTPDYCHCDLAAYLDNTNTLLTFELKKRNIPSTLYGDAIILKKKYNYLTESKDKLQAIYPDLKIRNILVTFYIDDVFGMWNINDYSSEGVIRMTATTEKTYGSKRMVEELKLTYLFKDALLKVSDKNISKIYEK